MSIAAGTKLGRYEIRTQLGAGGMGEVYLAQDTKLDRKVALKILPAEVAAHSDRMKRFVQEAKAASALNHPNIITIHEIDKTDSGHFIATEFIDGETLREHMRSAPMKLNKVLDVAAQIASALGAAHATGIVHRDIKPENVMLRRDGIVKVLDFGLAKLAERTSPDLVDTEAATRANVKTEPGVVMGTAIYMSPEQARGLPVDRRTDIFSLGALIYEIVAGRLPFEGSNTNEILASILSDKEPRPLTRYSSEAPIELGRIVLKALRKNRDERYQTIEDMLLDLQSLKQQLEFEAKLERSMPPDVSGGAIVTASGEQTISQDPESPPSQTAELSTPRPPSRKAINSLAVLPLLNASTDPDMEYLSDGITESIISSLSQLPKLKVMSRSTVFRYKGQEVDLQQVGRDLNVRAIVQGRVLQLGDNLILGVELVSVADGSQLWGEQYKRKLSDVFEMQEEIAREISEKLRLRLTREQKKRLTKRHTENAEAYQLYLKGRYFWNQRSVEGLYKSIGYFNHASEIDPNYALAYSGLADSYSVLGSDYLISPKEAFARARTVARRALEIDDQLAEAHISLAIIELFYDWDWAEGEKECQQAIRLNPSYATAHYVYAQYLAAAGRFEDAIREALRSQELDPLVGDINTTVGWVYYFARRIDEAIEKYKRVIEIDPNFLRAHRLLGLCYLQKNRPDEAMAEIERSVALSENRPEETAYLGYAYAVVGRRDEAREVIEKLKALSNERYVSPYLIALIYAGLDERDQVMEWLEKSHEARPVNMMYLKVDPKFDSVRSDPRFQDLMQRVGLPQ